MPYTFAAVKGQQKLTEFYLSTLDYGEIATLVTLPEEFYGDQLLDGDEDAESPAEERALAIRHESKLAPPHGATTSFPRRASGRLPTIFRRSGRRTADGEDGTSQPRWNH